MTPTVKPAPQPTSSVEKERWLLQGRAHRMLTGDWRVDAENRLSEFFHVSIRNVLPKPDTSHNAFLSLTSQKCVLYDDEPVVTLTDADDTEGLEIITPPEFWGVVQRAAFLAEGVGECLVRFDLARDAKGDATGITWRDVPAHTVILTPRRPDDTQPTRVEGLRERVKANGETVWAWDVWDVTDPAKPKFAIMAQGEAGVLIDATEEFVPGLGGAYPYLDTSNAPILPYVLRHATMHAGLWDYRSRAELIDGTLTAAALWTLWLLGMRDGSTPVRFLFNGRMLAAEVRTPDGALGATVQAVVANPMAIHQVIDDNGSARIDQLGPAINPVDMGTAIEMYEAGLAQYGGVSPADTQRGSSGMSGYAIVVSRDGLRKAQKRMMPASRVADRLCLATSARLANAYLPGLALPEDPTGYALRYADVSRTPDEIKATIESARVQIEAGLLHPADAYGLLNPGTDRDAAMAAMFENIRARKLLEAVAAEPVRMMPDGTDKGRPPSEPEFTADPVTEEVPDPPAEDDNQDEGEP